jgi:hypothetical protein
MIGELLHHEHRFGDWIRTDRSHRESGLCENGRAWVFSTPMTGLRKLRTHAARLGLAALLATLGAGCGGPPAKGANPTRTLDERRAVEIIIGAFRDERAEPVPGRKITLEEGKQLEVDVGAANKKFGVAYVTANERRLLGGALPTRDPSMGDALQLVHGTGDDLTAKILVLHDLDYTYDDQVGTSHESTTITAERKLGRDVRDFVVRAHAEKWP